MRKIWDIHGGIHPPENKRQSNGDAIRFAGIPDELIFPLSQHIGAPATPTVAVGDSVLKGQEIAAAKGLVSAPVHASTSGEVIAIELRTVPHPSGMSAPCIVIKPDGHDSWIDHSGVENYKSLPKSELISRVRQAGIAGMGGAGFPTAVKLTPRDNTSINTLIINGTECEPYITADDVLMRERATDIITGVNILRHIVAPTEETLIGVEDNKPEAIDALRQAAEGFPIEVVVFPTKYPSGGEKQLIQILTGKEVPSGGLPADIGIICQNVGTTVAIKKAIIDGEPLVSRVTTVTGDACKQQCNFEVLLGTPIRHLLSLCGYQPERNSRLVMGGPMMGFTLEAEDIPVVKTTNCIIAATSAELPQPSPPQACIRCGMCAEACPASLLPQQLYWFARGKEYEKLEAHNLMDCIECGACSYVCPSNIPLVQYYRASKAEIHQQKLDARTAEHSKARFEARKARIEREEAEKAAKRAARKVAAQARAAAARSEQREDPVQAAIDRAKAKKSEVDPAQAAIEKAIAKRAGTVTESEDRASLEQALSKAEKRLQTATEKLQQAEQSGADNVDALRKGVEKTGTKVEQARAALDKYMTQNPDSPEPKPSNEVPLSGDAAQDAIARALAKRAAASKMTDAERLQNAVDSITKRLDKARAKLAEAEANSDDNVEILSNTVEKLSHKLAEAEQAQRDYISAKSTTN